eukprot:10787521-Lingulodinium_polyedra.AAC.1
MQHRRVVLDGVRDDGGLVPHERQQGRLTVTGDLAQPHFQEPAAHPAQGLDHDAQQDALQRVLLARQGSRRACVAPAGHGMPRD